MLFASGYLFVWAAAGVAAYGLFHLGRSLFGHDLDWHAGGGWFAGGVLALAALYELTPLKDVCLAKCRSPLGFLLGTWRDGRRGALEMGARHAAWCVGCCWALMAALFALGVMSLAWMALVAALITARSAMLTSRSLVGAEELVGHVCVGLRPQQGSKATQLGSSPRPLVTPAIVHTVYAIHVPRRARPTVPGPPAGVHRHGRSRPYPVSSAASSAKTST